MILIYKAIEIIIIRMFIMIIILFFHFSFFIYNYNLIMSGLGYRKGTDSIPLLIKMCKLNDNILVIVNNQFFLDPLSSDESKSFLSSGNDVYKLEQLNMKGPGFVPCRGILFRQYPNSYVTARRLDNGDYIILDNFKDKPQRSQLEEIFFDDSEIRDSSLSFIDKLKRFVPNFGN